MNATYVKKKISKFFQKIKKGPENYQKIKNFQKFCQK